MLICILGTTLSTFPSDREVEADWPLFLVAAKRNPFVKFKESELVWFRPCLYIGGGRSLGGSYGYFAVRESAWKGCSCR